MLQKLSLLLWYFKVIPLTRFSFCKSSLTKQEWFIAFIFTFSFRLNVARVGNKLFTSLNKQLIIHCLMFFSLIQTNKQTNKQTYLTNKPYRDN